MFSAAFSSQKSQVVSSDHSAEFHSIVSDLADLLKLNSKLVFEVDVSRATAICSTALTKWELLIGHSIPFSGSFFLFEEVIPCLHSFLCDLSKDARLVWRPLRVCCREGMPLLEILKASPLFSLESDSVGSFRFYVSQHGPLHSVKRGNCWNCAWLWHPDSCGG